MEAKVREGHAPAVVVSLAQGEQLVSELSEEALDVSVLPGRTWPDEFLPHLVGFESLG